MANSRLCSIPDCGKPHKGRGYCQGHLVRLNKHGSTMADIPIRELGKTERFIRQAAKVEYSEECLFWPYGKDPVGRGIGTYNGRHMLASRAVCIEAHGIPITGLHEAAHSCGNGHLGCVNPHHLRWATRKENEADKLLHGTRLRGEQAKNAVLTDSQCDEIRALRGKKSQRQIARMYGVTQQHVSAIQTGKFRAKESSFAAAHAMMRLMVVVLVGGRLAPGREYPASRVSQRTSAEVEADDSPDDALNFRARIWRRAEL